MSNRKILNTMAFIIATIIWLPSCYKETTVFLGASEVTREVSFNNDLIPIFENRCALSGCHTAGSQVPTLTPDRAYNALIEENLVDFNNPENSELYFWLTGKKQPAMPLGGPDPDINAIVLAWLKQGGKNN
jgi:hypothetical protein